MYKKKSDTLSRSLFFYLLVNSRPLVSKYGMPSTFLKYPDAHSPAMRHSGAAFLLSGAYFVNLRRKTSACFKVSKGRTLRIGFNKMLN